MKQACETGYENYFPPSSLASLFRRATLSCWGRNELWLLCRKESSTAGDVPFWSHAYLSNHARAVTPSFSKFSLVLSIGTPPFQARLWRSGTCRSMSWPLLGSASALPLFGKVTLRSNLISRSLSFLLSNNGAVIFISRQWRVLNEVTDVIVPSTDSATWSFYVQIEIFLKLLFTWFMLPKLTIVYFFYLLRAINTCPWKIVTYCCNSLWCVCGHIRRMLTRRPMASLTT